MRTKRSSANDADESNFYQGWKTGYMVGAGVEHAFTLPLSGKIDYLYADGFGPESGRNGLAARRSQLYP